MSYDVNSLFTSIPIDPGITIIRKYLEHDSQTHLLFPGILFEEHIFSIQRQVLWTNRRGCYGVTHQSHSSQPFYGRPRSPGHHDITFTPVLWKRFVDDTFTIIKETTQKSFLEHLKTINPSIKFTSEETRPDGFMSFLDILITPMDDSSLQTSVYRNPHTLTYIYSGTATTQFHQNTVWWEHCITEQKPSAQTKMCCTRKNNTFSSH